MGKYIVAHPLHTYLHLTRTVTSMNLHVEKEVRKCYLHGIRSRSNDGGQDTRNCRANICTCIKQYVNEGTG